MLCDVRVAACCVLLPAIRAVCGVMRVVRCVMCAVMYVAFGVTCGV